MSVLFLFQGYGPGRLYFHLLEATVRQGRSVLGCCVQLPLFGLRPPPKVGPWFEIRLEGKDATDVGRWVLGTLGVPDSP